MKYITRAIEKRFKGYDGLDEVLSDIDVVHLALSESVFNQVTKLFLCMKCLQFATKWYSIGLDREIQTKNTQSKIFRGTDIKIKRLDLGLSMGSHES